MDRYGWGPQDISDGRISHRPVEPQILEVRRGMVIEEVQSGWVGAAVTLRAIGGERVVGLEDRHGAVREFPMGYGFLYEGEPVKLTVPQAPTKNAPQRTRSGSVAVHGAKARTARASRIVVEGLHDAELIEKVWGEDLRIEGIVVEPLHGLDHVADYIREFQPNSQRRLGVLADHLVPGSKESKLAEEAMRLPGARSNVLFVGHPYVDVWESVKPATVGLDVWPTVPRGEDWKTGILQRIGWPHSTPAQRAIAWKKILSSVNTYSDLDPGILGPVEHIIDFLTEPPASAS
ncbi:DUF3097 family protein [uncultured Kocuria sp.]|uniref:DUF3097 family protein n=1 Tax=uncultured Kocuria sp. TaxID=259305 RepID=UPI00259ACDF0|nr:DUF3097 family protein [uncultured Kocuria sp.]MCT1366786.1 DUF3097 domain-containing protein [Rothia sp. p3-SID1597]